MKKENQNKIYQERLDLLLSEMKKRGFKGKYNLNNNNNIEWNIDSNIMLEILLEGHGGDDLIIIYFTDPSGRKNENYDELNSNTNEELLKVLSEYNNYKIEIKEKKGLFGKKYILTYDGKETI